MKLYRITNGLGVYWTIAEKATEAEEKVMELLKNADYGFADDREAKLIEIIAEAPRDSKFITKKFLVL